VIVFQGDGEYDVISESEKEPEAKVAWNMAKKSYLEKTGQMF
jgi:hypothetical protein